MLSFNKFLAEPCYVTFGLWHEPSVPLELFGNIFARAISRFSTNTSLYFKIRP